MADRNRENGGRPDWVGNARGERRADRTGDNISGGTQSEQDTKGDRKFWNISAGWKHIQEHLGMDKIFLILLAGVLLLLSSVPFGKQSDKNSPQQSGDDGNAGTFGSAAGVQGTDRSQDSSVSYAAQLEERLEEVLLSVDGVGKVRVMITLKNNGEKQLQSDSVRERSNTGETDSAGGSRTIQEGREEYSTVILNDGTRDSPYVTRETAPEIEGVLVVAQGAGSASVKSEIYEAVQALFNVPAHKIKVLKGVLEN